MLLRCLLLNGGAVSEDYTPVSHTVYSCSLHYLDSFRWCKASSLLGSLLCSGVTVATGRLPTSTSWRTPFGLQIVPASILLLTVYLIPESPRWLMSVGRKSEARKILAEYHGNGDENAPLVLLELREFEESIKLDACDKSWWNYSPLFNSPTARYRSFMVLMMAFCSQWSGAGLLYFLTVLYNSAGVDTQNMRLILNVVNNLVSASAAVTGTIIADKVGRRPLWLWGTLGCAGTLAVSAACTAKWGSGANHAGAHAAIAFLFLFDFAYCFTYVPLQLLYPAECMDYKTRAKGVALYTLMSSMASFVNTYATPIALAKIQWKIYFVPLAWNLFACLFIWKFAVETKARTLEELNNIFEDRNPVKASLALISSPVVSQTSDIIMRTLHVQVEEETAARDCTESAV